MYGPCNELAHLHRKDSPSKLPFMPASNAGTQMDRKVKLQGQWEVSEVEVRGKEAIRRLQRVEGFIYVDRGAGFRVTGIKFHNISV